MHTLSKLDVALRAVAEDERRLNQQVVLVAALAGCATAQIIAQQVMLEMGYNLGLSRSIVAILQILALS